MNEIIRNNFIFSLFALMQSIDTNISELKPLFDKDSIEPYQITIYYKDKAYTTVISTKSLTLKQIAIEVIKKGVIQ